LPRSILVIIDDQFQTIIKPVETSLRIKASKFIGYAVPVETPDRFKEILQLRAKEYHDATHHCWAYRIILDENVDHASSDAGEPSGTAGKPILLAIEGRDLVNVGVIVTRYFGGTKLGTGGLARAYANCTDLTLDAAKIITEIITTKITCQFPYDYTNIVMRTVDRYNGTVISSYYDKDADLTISLPRSQIDSFKKELSNACRGNIQFTNHNI